MSSENSSAGDPNAFCKAKEKVSVQQSLINSNARNLKRLKESTTRLSSNSPNLNGLTLSSASDGEAPSAIDDDIKLQEVHTVVNSSCVTVSAAAINYMHKASCVCLLMNLEYVYVFMWMCFWIVFSTPFTPGLPICCTQC